MLLFFHQQPQPHYLALNLYEIEAIKTAKQKYGKVVIVLVTSATMELRPLMSGEYEADTILRISHPGETQKIELSFTKDDITNYFYDHKNTDGTNSCYILEGGTYTVALKKNSHETIEERTFDIKDTIFYDGSDDNHIRKTDIEAQSALKDDRKTEDFPTAEKDISARFVIATNQFEVSSKYMNDNSTNLSRSNWSQTQSSLPTLVQKAVNNYFKQYLNYEINFDIEKVINLVIPHLVFSTPKKNLSFINAQSISFLRAKDSQISSVFKVKKYDTFFGNFSKNLSFFTCSFFD